MPDPGTTYRSLWSFFWPLAISDILMTAIHPLIMAGIARHSGEPVSLAIYGSVISVIVLVESPIIMLMHSANTLVTNMGNYFVVRKYSLLLTAVTGLPIILLAFSSWGTTFLTRWMGLSPGLAQPTSEVLQFFIPWPLLVGWRRFCQGVLIRLGSTFLVGMGTFIRLLVVMTVVLFTGVLHSENSVQNAALLLVMSMAVETLAISLFTLRVMRQGKLKEAQETRSLTVRGVHHFYVPLLFTTMLLVAARPIMIAGLARVPNAEFAIAAWSLVLSVTTLFSNHLRVVQHMVIALADSPQKYLRIARFSRVIGLTSTVALAFVALTPLGKWFLESVMAIEGTLLDIVRLGLALTCLVPVLRALQNEKRGILMTARSTKTINLAAIANGSVLAGGAFLVATLTLPGLATIAGMFTMAYLVEVMLLGHSLREGQFSLLEA